MAHGVRWYCEQRVFLHLDLSNHLDYFALTIHRDAGAQTLAECHLAKTKGE